jgi:hypothetical protein
MQGEASKTKEKLSFLSQPTVFGYEVHNGKGDEGYYHCREALIRDAKTYASKPSGKKIFFNNLLRIAHNSVTTDSEISNAVYCLDTLLIPVAIYTAPSKLNLSELKFYPGKFSTEKGKFSDGSFLYGGAENPKCIITYEGIPSELLWYSPVHASLFFGVAKLCLTISKKYPDILKQILPLREKSLKVANSKSKVKAKGVILSLKNILSSKYTTADSDLMPMVTAASFLALDKLSKETSIKLADSSSN